MWLFKGYKVQLLVRIAVAVSTSGDGTGVSHPKSPLPSDSLCGR